jgi:hypothetical protein
VFNYYESVTANDHRQNKYLPNGELRREIDFWLGNGEGAEKPHLASKHREQHAE